MSTVEKTNTSITDSPISKFEEDFLKLERYAKSLSTFIQNSDTPITIGLQGEWGTGKTSLMGLINQDFSEGKSIATSWVNTWEYSMFKGARETTPSVLKGMLEKLQKSCEDRGIEFQKDIGKSIKDAGKFLSGIANQFVAAKTGVDIKSATSNTSAIVAEIAEIKDIIKELIQKLIEDDKNPVQKVVFFVDDLDRIPPTDAVEVLESLKNIFDIPRCVFILAIDYDVVVKGLESKFGPKTKENEREFRSFFDKIIQVPFTMPVGAYDISQFLEDKLSRLGIKIDQDDDIEKLTKIVGYTVGNNPRSLKRYLNTFSLINQIIEDDEDADHEPNLILLFSSLGIQISYPEIFRLLTQNPNYINWDKEFSNKIGLDLEKTIEDLKIIGESEYTDENWEKIVWGVCQKDPFLKVKCYSILELLNYLRKNAVKEEDKLSDELTSVLEFASITNVDDDLATKQAVNKVGARTYFEGIDGYIQNNKKPKEWGDLITEIDKTLKKLYSDKIQNGHILVDYSKTGGLVFNWKKKSGGKFFQLRYGKTSKGLNQKFQIPPTDYLACILYKSTNEYQHPEILTLMPAQYIHSTWMFECVIRNKNDFEQLLNSSLIDKSIESISAGERFVHPSCIGSNLNSGEIKTVTKEAYENDIDNLLKQNIKF